MVRHPHLFAAAAALLALATSQSAQAVTPRLTADPEKKVLERAGWTYIGMSDDVLIYMKDAIPAANGGARRVVTAYEALSPHDREGFSFRSVESLGEFDCENGRSRIVRETFYEQPSLKGQTWSKGEAAAAEWTDTVEGSVGMLRIAFACRDKPVA